MSPQTVKKRSKNTRARREKNKKVRRWLLPSLAFLAVSAAALLGLEALRCSHEFIVTAYRIETDKVKAPVRMVLFSDLHENEFGEGNSRLINAVAALEPDIIFCVGDMITLTDTEEQTLIGLDFLEAAAGIAPTYMALGNHEVSYVKMHGAELLRQLEYRGVKILNEEYAEVETAGQTVRVGGVYDYCFNYGQTQEAYRSSHKYRFFKELCDTENYTVLLCHRPTAYYLESEANYYEDWDIDLVLCGHTHGGLWRLPVIGSIYLPQQGFFPQLDWGKKDMGNADMIIGAGLGHEAVLFRLFDPCEIVCIELVPQE